MIAAMKQQWIIDRLREIDASQEQLGAAMRPPMEKTSINKRIHGRYKFRPTDVPRLAEFLRLPRETVIARLYDAETSDLGEAELARPITGKIPADMGVTIDNLSRLIQAGAYSWPAALELSRSFTAQIESAIDAQTGSKSEPTKTSNR
ncbi:MAG: hypothetical protein QOJ54_1026 [Aliidongia sp.]|jgi:hypothetical protein|nr:hypothetical protein [Aliidongia sp.]